MCRHQHADNKHITMNLQCIFMNKGVGVASTPCATALRVRVGRAGRRRHRGLEPTVGYRVREAEVEEGAANVGPADGGSRVEGGR
jgi:hypothetical protein